MFSKVENFSKFAFQRIDAISSDRLFIEMETSSIFKVGKCEIKLTMFGSGPD